MARCATCGGLLGRDAEWCGQCFAPVGPASPEQSSPSPQGGGSAQAPPPGPNSATSAAPSPTPPIPAEPSPTRPLSAAAALAAIPPDLQITLASAGSTQMTLLTDRGKSIITSVIVMLAVGSDALFFPYAKYMVFYGIFVGLASSLAIWRLWSRRSVTSR